MKTGDRVEILVGHPYWRNGDNGVVRDDLRPEYVGKKATISKINKDSYGLDIDGIGKVSWFKTWQIKPVVDYKKHILRWALRLIVFALGYLFGLWTIGL